MPRLALLLLLVGLMLALLTEPVAAQWGWGYGWGPRFHPGWGFGPWGYGGLGYWGK